MRALYLLGGHKDKDGKQSMSTTQVLRNKTWTEGLQLKADEGRGCSVAISPFEFITMHSPGTEGKKGSGIKVFKYNIMTGSFRHYTTDSQPKAVSTSLNFSLTHRLLTIMLYLLEFNTNNGC